MRAVVAAEDGRLRRELADLLGGWGWAIEVFAEGRGAWEAVEAPGGPRLALWSVTLPALDGRQVAERLRGPDAPRYVYLLLVAGRGDADMPLAALEAGADDCLFLPVNAAELRLRLAMVRRALALRERLAALEQVRAAHPDRDPLTEVWNRRTITELLAQELERARRNGDWVATIAVDLDAFKRLNERLGQEAGDALLREAVARLRTTVRGSDWLGRNVAAKFFLILPGCNADRALATAERLRRALADRAFALPAGAETVTASIGVAVDRAGSLAAEQLLERATEARERAKAEGGNAVRHAPPTAPGQLPLA